MTQKQSILPMCLGNFVLLGILRLWLWQNNRENVGKKFIKLYKKFIKLSNTIIFIIHCHSFRHNVLRSPTTEVTSRLEHIIVTAVVFGGVCSD
jgi:hypothetical protein